MAKKSKGFGKLLKQKRTENARQETLEKLERRLRHSSIGEQVAEIVTNQKGEVNMSTVLKAFVEPYLDHASNRNQRKNLFSLAILAWNLTLIPENDQKSMIEKIIKQGLEGNNPLAQQETREVIAELMARKQKIFADNHRYIVSYELNDTGNEYQIAVASTPMINTNE